MKKLFTLALFVSLLINSFASSELFMKIRKYGNFIVSVNDQTMQNNTGKFRFFDLNKGYYTITVRENSWNNGIVFQQTVQIRNGYRYVAEISPRYGLRLIARYPIVQTNWYLDNVNTNVPRPFQYGNPVNNNGNHNGWYNKNKNNGQNNDDDNDADWYNNNWNTDDVYINDNDNWNTNGSQNYPNTNSGWNNNGNNNSGWGNANDNNNNNNSGWHNPNYGPNWQNNGNNAGKAPMSDGEMQTLLTTMKGVNFEEKMIDVAKSATKNRWVNTNQIRQMLDLFSFEKNKLDLAKYLYDYTSDRDNYYTLVSAFNFSSNQKELNDYIKNKK